MCTMEQGVFLALSDQAESAQSNFEKSHQRVIRQELGLNSY